MKAPKVLILRAAGTNCDLETENAFKSVGAAPERVHISEIKSGKSKLMSYDMLVIPGGFSYGDDVAAGRILANQVRVHLKDLRQFVRLGRPVIGICNGFQVLVKAGILPSSNTCDQTASFTFNDSAKFESRWVHLRICRVCGHVGCCDQSPGRHATGHFHATGHPVMEAYYEPDGWGWCYVDEVMIDLGGDVTPHPPGWTW